MIYTWHIYVVGLVVAFSSQFDIMSYMIVTADVMFYNLFQYTVILMVMTLCILLMNKKKNPFSILLPVFINS